MKPIAACIFVVSFLMIFASLVRFYVFVMPPGGSKMLAVDVSVGPYQWLGRSPSYHEVLTPVQLLPRLQKHHHHHHHTQAPTTTTPQTSLTMDQEEKKQVQSIRDHLKGHSLRDGGEIVGSINSSSSDFTATNNRAHIVRQYESGSTASERKTTRETPDRKGITFSLFILEDLPLYFVCKLIDFVSVCILLAIYLLCSKVPPPPKAPEKFKKEEKKKEEKKKDEEPKRYHCYIPPPPPPPPPPPYPYSYPYPYPYQSYIPPENLRQYFGLKRKDAAARLNVSVSTFKRKCRQQGIMRWPGMGSRVSKLPNQHGERNTSTACETPSHNVQTGMEVELFGQNGVANVVRRDFMGGPNALDTESGLIMVSRPPDQHGGRNTSTACETPSHNVENEMGCQNSKPMEFHPDSFEDLNFWNTDIGSIAEILSDCEFLALEEEPSLEGSVNLTVAACSDPAQCQHPMPTIPNTMTTTHMMPHLPAKGDMRFVTLKVTYGKKIIRFQFPLMSGIIELKEEVKKRLKLELGSFDVEYKDEDGDCIFLGCDEDLRNHLQLFSNQVIRLLVVDSDANTTNLR